MEYLFFGLTTMTSITAYASPPSEVSQNVRNAGGAADATLETKLLLGNPCESLHLKALRPAAWLSCNGLFASEHDALASNKSDHNAEDSAEARLTETNTINVINKTTSSCSLVPPYASGCCSMLYPGLPSSLVPASSSSLLFHSTPFFSPPSSFITEPVLGTSPSLSPFFSSPNRMSSSTTADQPVPRPSPLSRARTSLKHDVSHDAFSADCADASSSMRAPDWASGFPHSMTAGSSAIPATRSVVQPVISSPRLSTSDTDSGLTLANAICNARPDASALVTSPISPATSECHAKKTLRQGLKHDTAEQRRSKRARQNDISCLQGVPEASVNRPSSSNADRHGKSMFPTSCDAASVQHTAEPPPKKNESLCDDSPKSVGQISSNGHLTHPIGYIPCPPTILLNTLTTSTPNPSTVPFPLFAGYSCSAPYWLSLPFSGDPQGLSAEKPLSQASSADDGYRSPSPAQAVFLSTASAGDGAAAAPTVDSHTLGYAAVEEATKKVPDTPPQYLAPLHITASLSPVPVGFVSPEAPLQSSAEAQGVPFPTTRGINVLEPSMFTAPECNGVAFSAVHQVSALPQPVLPDECERKGDLPTSGSGSHARRMTATGSKRCGAPRRRSVAQSDDGHSVAQPETRHSAVAVQTDQNECKEPSPPKRKRRLTHLHPPTVTTSSSSSSSSSPPATNRSNTRGNAKSSPSGHLESIAQPSKSTKGGRRRQDTRKAQGSTPSSPTEAEHGLLFELSSRGLERLRYEQLSATSSRDLSIGSCADPLCNVKEHLEREPGCVLRSSAGGQSAGCYLWRHDVLLTDERLPASSTFTTNRPLASPGPSSNNSRMHLASHTASQTTVLHTSETAAVDVCSSLIRQRSCGPNEVQLLPTSFTTETQEAGASYSENPMCRVSHQDEPPVHNTALDRPLSLLKSKDSLGVPHGLQPELSAIPPCLKSPPLFSSTSNSCSMLVAAPGGTCAQSTAAATSVMHSPFSTMLQWLVDDVVTT